MVWSHAGAGLARPASQRATIAEGRTTVHTDAVAEGWEEVDGALQQQFAFANFVEALAFVNRVGDAAEEADHHPDMTIHDYKHVTVRWRSHDVGAISDRDHRLATRTDELVAP